MDCRYKARWRARFWAKNRAVTGELSDARVTSDRLFAFDLKHSLYTFCKMSTFFVSRTLESFKEFTRLLLSIFHFTFGSSSQTHMAMFCLFLWTRILYNVLKEILRPSFIRVIICGLKLISQIKKGSTLVCSAHFKPDDMYKTITGLTRLKRGAEPSKFAWTREGKERRPNKLQESKVIAEQQSQEQRRQFFVDSIQQDVEMEEEETESAGQETNAGAEPMQVMSMDGTETKTVTLTNWALRNKLKYLRRPDIVFHFSDARYLN